MGRQRTNSTLGMATQIKPAANSALAIWRGEEYMLSFLFTKRLQFQRTNNAEQQNKQ